MDNKEFLETLYKNNEFFSNNEFVVLSKFKDLKTKMIVKDKYGYLKVFPQSLLKGGKPSIVSAIFKTEYFKNKLNFISKNYYKRRYKIISEYKGCYKNIIVQTKHGVHSLSINGLLLDKMPSIKSAVNKTDYALNELFYIHKNKYKYPNFKFINSKKKFKIICNKTGNTFFRNLDTQKKIKVNKNLIKNCSTKDFIKKAKKLHKDKYIYDLVNYKKAKIKVKIICPEHGTFEQTPNNHLSGTGCKKCNSYLGSFKSWKKIGKDKEATLYIIECFNTDERFLKVGITTKTIKERFCKTELMPYKYKILYLYKDYNLYNVWSNERFIKKLFKHYKYEPKIKFGGYTECLKKESTEEVLGFLKDFKELSEFKCFQELWHLLAKCELYIKENNINIKEYSKKYLKNLASKSN